MTNSDHGKWLNIKSLNTTRGLTLMATGAVGGLILAAIGLFTAKGTTTLYVPPEDVALVNQVPISRSDFIMQIRALYEIDLADATPEQRQKVLSDMIREELFVQRGTELDVAAVDPETRAAMVSAVEQQAVADAMTDVPSDEELLEYYNKNKARYSSEGYMNLRDIVFPAPTSQGDLESARSMSADQAIAKFGAKDSGKIPSATEFYFAADLHLGADLSAVAKALSDGAVSAPMTMPDGIHVIYMIKNTEPVARDFNLAKAQILTDYRRDNAKRLLEKEQDFLRNRANILIAEDLK